MWHAQVDDEEKQFPSDVVFGVVRMQVPKRVGRHPPSTLQGELKQLLRLDSENSRAHYVAYLNQLEHGDYPAAVDSLHRYFDFSAAQPAAADANTRGGIMGAALGATSWQVSERGTGTPRTIPAPVCFS